MAGYIGSKTSVVSSGVERKKTYSITGSTTSLTGLNYTVGKVHVYQNGVRLLDGTDYTATNGTSITLTVAAQSGDNVVVVSQASFQLSESYTSTESDARYVQPTHTGNLNITGTVTADGLSLGDYADALTIGDSNDLSLYHAGGSSTIKSDTGQLIIRTDAFRVLNNANSEQILHGDANGAVTLYYDNSSKLATTSTGIDVTGTVTSDGLTVDGNASIAANLPTFTITGQGRANGFEIAGTASNTTLTEKSNNGLTFGTNNTERMRITSSGNVNIGSTNSGASGSLDVSIGSTSSSGGVTLWSPTNGIHSLGFGDGYTGSDRYRGYVEYSHSDDSMRLATGATERMRIDSSGYVVIGSTLQGSQNAVTISQVGFVQARRASGAVGFFDRLTNDGAIIQLRKQGADVGAISSSGDDLNIGTGDTGIGFADSLDAILPMTSSGNTVRSSAINIGTSSYKFKDGHFSGNLYGDGSNLTGVGGSTTFGAVGTYIWGRPANTTDYSNNDTASGLKAITNVVGAYGGVGFYQGSSWAQSNEQTSMSGTWRHMGGAGSNGYRAQPGIWVRIS